jgi:hypothetical protein
MISSDAVQEIADGWVEEFSVDPYVLRERRMDAWCKLNELVYDCPSDALLVFEKVAEKELINWTFEGFAAGPIRTFLMIYGDRHDGELAALGRRSRAFEEMWAMAAEGL